MCIEWVRTHISGIPGQGATITLNRLPDVTTIHIPTCVCGSLPQRSVQTTTILSVLQSLYTNAYAMCTLDIAAYGFHIFDHPTTSVYIYVICNMCYGNINEETTTCISIISYSVDMQLYCKIYIV